MTLQESDKRSGTLAPLRTGAIAVGALALGAAALGALAVGSASGNSS